MNNNDIAFELKQLTQTVQSHNALIQKLLTMVNPKNEMWDAPDMIQNWKVSKRLLATWREEGIIDYVQVGNKIWYPREAREEFVTRFIVKSKKEVEEIIPIQNN